MREEWPEAVWGTRKKEAFSQGGAPKHPDDLIDLGACLHQSSCACPSQPSELASHRCSGPGPLYQAISANFSGSLTCCPDPSASPTLGRLPPATLTCFAAGCCSGL